MHLDFKLINYDLLNFIKNVYYPICVIKLSNGNSK